MDIEALKAELIEHQIMEDCSLPDSVMSLDQAHNVSISTLPVDISSRLRTPLQMRSKLSNLYNTPLQIHYVKIMQKITSGLSHQDFLIRTGYHIYIYMQ
jgi:hypothetical protein